MEEDLKQAFENYQDFKKTQCQPQNVTLCTQSLLNLQPNPNILMIPRGLKIQRCQQSDSINQCGKYVKKMSNSNEHNPLLASLYHYGQSVWTMNDSVGINSYWEFDQDQPNNSLCNCESPEEECLATNVNIKFYVVVVMQVI